MDMWGDEMFALTNRALYWGNSTPNFRSWYDMILDNQFNPGGENIYRLEDEVNPERWS